MINTEKLNKTIKGLEEDIENIRSISELYQKLNILSDDVKADQSLYKDLIKNINEISNDLKTTSEMLNDSANQLEKRLKEIEAKIDKKVDKMQKENQASIKKITDSYKNYENRIDKKTSKNIEIIKKEYKNFSDEINSKYEQLNLDYIEKIEEIKVIFDDNSNILQKNITKKLDANKKSLTSEVKNLNYEIQNSLMNFFSTKFEAIENNFVKKSEEDKADFKNLKKLLKVSILVGIVSIVINLFY